MVVLFTAAGFAGAYFWQQSQVNDTQTALKSANAKVSALQKQQTSATATEDTSSDLVPGPADATKSDGVHVTPVYRSLSKITALWVEYGSTPASFPASTTKLTTGLGEGAPAKETDYASGEVAVIPLNALKAGTGYYYRVAATIDGKTVYSGPAYFVMPK